MEKTLKWLADSEAYMSVPDYDDVSVPEYPCTRCTGRGRLKKPSITDLRLPTILIQNLSQDVKLALETLKCRKHPQLHQIFNGSSIMFEQRPSRSGTNSVRDDSSEQDVGDLDATIQGNGDGSSYDSHQPKHENHPIPPRMPHKGLGSYQKPVGKGRSQSLRDRMRQTTKKPGRQANLDNLNAVSSISRLSSDQSSIKSAESAPLTANKPSHIGASLPDSASLPDHQRSVFSGRHGFGKAPPRKPVCKPISQLADASNDTDSSSSLSCDKAFPALRTNLTCKAVKDPFSCKTDKDLFSETVSCVNGAHFTASSSACSDSGLKLSRAPSEKSDTPINWEDLSTGDVTENSKSFVPELIKPAENDANLSSGQVSENNVILSSGQVSVNNVNLSSGQVSVNNVNLSSGQDSENNVNFSSGQVSENNVNLSDGQVSENNVNFSSGQVSDGDDKSCSSSQCNDIEEPYDEPELSSDTDHSSAHYGKVFNQFPDRNTPYTLFEHAYVDSKNNPIVFQNRVKFTGGGTKFKGFSMAHLKTPETMTKEGDFPALPVEAQSAKSEKAAEPTVQKTSMKDLAGFLLSDGRVRTDNVEEETSAKPVTNSIFEDNQTDADEYSGPGATLIIKNLPATVDDTLLQHLTETIQSYGQVLDFSVECDTVTDSSTAMIKMRREEDAAWASECFDGDEISVPGVYASEPFQCQSCGTDFKMVTYFMPALKSRERAECGSNQSKVPERKSLNRGASFPS